MPISENDRLIIEVGTRANDGNGSTLREAADIVNTNFEMVFQALGADPNTTFVNELVAGTGISLQYTGDVAGTGSVTVTNTAPNIRAYTTIAVDDATPVVATSSINKLKIVSGSSMDITQSTTANSTEITVGVDWEAVQADWDITNNTLPGYIKNKPTDINDFTDTTNKFGHVSRLYTAGGSITLATDGTVELAVDSLSFPNDSGTLTYDINPDIPSLDISAGGPNRILNLYTNDKSFKWVFENNGNITFPDTSVQKTAWNAGRVIDVPLSSKGIVGNRETDMAFSSDAIYYCVSDYTDGTDDIWVKTPWAVTGTW